MVESPDVGSLPLFPVLPVLLVLILLLPSSACEKVRGVLGPWWAAQTWTYPLLYYASKWDRWAGVSWTGGGPVALTGSERGRRVEHRLDPSTASQWIREATEGNPGLMNVRSIGGTNAEIVGFLPPPLSPERLPHPRTCLGLCFLFSHCEVRSLPGFTCH